jgi:hypothetical protein
LSSTEELLLSNYRRELLLEPLIHTGKLLLEIKGGNIVACTIHVRENYRKIIIGVVPGNYLKTTVIFFEEILLQNYHQKITHHH